jgi:hypothetical protein
VDYDAFNAALVASLSVDARVTGLVAVGSMAARDYLPDASSDHDFLVITTPDAQEELRADLSWLPRHDEIVLSFRETAHGLKVLYRDGHLLEFAVFDPDELGAAAVNRYRVLLDRGGIEARLRELATRPPDRPSDEYLFGRFVTGVQVGAGRTRRGEALSGASFLLSAARHLCALFARVLPAPGRSLLDDLDPLRRFERVYPELGQELGSALDDPRALLELAERELRPLRPDLPWRGLDAVRAREELRSKA